MPRRRRIDLTSPLLHIWTRGVDRQDIFTTDRDRQVFEQRLADMVEHTGVSIHAYAFMHNHVHLIVDRRNGDVSAALGGVLARYATYFNRSTERTGPLFSGRFGATSIDTDDQALQCSRYVHLNPLEFVPRPAIAAYRWSSLGIYAERRPNPGWVTTDFLAALRHRSPSEYVRYVLEPQSTDQHGRPRRPWDVLTLDDVDDTVADVTRQRPAIDPSGRLNTSARIAVAAAIELRVRASADIAAHHGLASAVTARTTARRTRVHAQQDPALDRQLRQVVDRLRAAAELDPAA